MLKSAIPVSAITAGGLVAVVLEAQACGFVNLTSFQQWKKVCTHPCVLCGVRVKDCSSHLKSPLSLVEPVRPIIPSGLPFVKIFDGHKKGVPFRVLQCDWVVLF